LKSHLTRFRFKQPVAEDEIDLDSGFLMVPQAIPQPEPPPGSLPAVPGGLLSEPGDSIGIGDVPPGGIAQVSPPLSAVDKTVELTFSADRNQTTATCRKPLKIKTNESDSNSLRADEENGPTRIRTWNQGIMSPLLCR
jgi:hypothetical protein